MKASIFLYFLLWCLNVMVGLHVICVSMFMLSCKYMLNSANFSGTENSMLHDISVWYWGYCKYIYVHNMSCEFCMLH